MLTTGLRLNSPSAVRYPRGAALGETTKEFATLPVGKGEIRRQGSGVFGPVQRSDGLEIPSSACNRAFRGFAWRYSDRYHEDLSSCVLYSQLRSCSFPDGLTAD